MNVCYACLKQFISFYYSMRTILSFDIGTRHLAYCCLKQTDIRTWIDQWKVVDLMSVPGTPYDESCVWVLSKSWKCGQLKHYLEQNNLSSQGKRNELIHRIHTHLKKKNIAKVTSSNLCVLASKMYAYLDNHPWMLHCDTIVLENQPCLTNPVMKSVQMLLYGYFLYKGIWEKHKHQMAHTLAISGAHTVQYGGSVDAPASPSISGDDTHEKHEKGHTVSSALPRVMLTSATNKLKVCRAELTSADTLPSPLSISGVETDKPKKSNYKERKKEAIALTHNILEQWEGVLCETSLSSQHSAWKQLLSNSCVKEKDDLSDSFLQGLYVLRKHTN